ISMVITTIWIVNKYLRVFLGDERRCILSIIPWFIFFLFQMVVNYYSGCASIVTTFINMILVFLIATLSYHKGTKNEIFLVIFLYVIWALDEMIVFYFMDFLKIPKQEANIIGGVISKIGMIIFIYLFSHIMDKKNSTFVPVNYYLILLFIPIGSIYIAIQEFFGSKTKPVSSMMVFSILLLINVLIFEIYSKLAAYFLYEKENAVYAQQVDIMLRNTQEQKKMLEDFHEKRHNLVNELIILKYYVDNSDFTTVKDCLGNIIQGYESINERISNCGNVIIDAIINFKYILAKEKQIDFQVKIFIPDELPMEQCDLGVVIGNAIDNAIEAVEKCEKKKIEITMGIKKESLIIVIRNPYIHKIKMDKEGRLISTKKDNEMHGYGMTSIRRVVEKYNGDLVIETNDNYFTLTISMNLE
ncbi:MAG TPA: GHKL domain-containing protein, partial [Lachnospiraceae bacterium]|nr:GHKL domain-containing protein [Lachnospiraceae bacterium]